VCRLRLQPSSVLEAVLISPALTEVGSNLFVGRYLKGVRLDAVPILVQLLRLAALVGSKRVQINAARQQAETVTDFPQEIEACLIDSKQAARTKGRKKGFSLGRV